MFSCPYEKSYLHLENTIENQRSPAPKSELCDSIAVFEGGFGPMGEAKDWDLKYSSCDMIGFLKMIAFA